MNEFQAFTKPVMGGYAGYLRLPSDGSPKPMLAKGGKPQIFATELQALACVTENLVRYINGHLYRTGEVAGGTMAAAEALFKPKEEGKPRPETVKQKGKTRRIHVERKRKGRR